MEGFRVLVLAANRGYDDPARRYRPRERIDGVEVARLPFSSFGKSNLAVRVAGQLSFLLQCALRGIVTRRLAGVVISTSPPMCSLAALVIAAWRRVPIKYWVMDVNPDQIVALGRLAPESLPVRLFERLNRWILARAADVVTLDEPMADRLRAKCHLGDRLSVIPPWPHDQHLEAVPHEENPFYREHGMAGRLILTYSGNHTPFHPIDTLLDAVRQLEDSGDLLFCFIGGGIDKRKVDRLVREKAPQNPIPLRGNATSVSLLGNLLSLPYQPLDRLKYSLSAADVHLVTMGADAVGCCHPSKIYAALAIGRPILFVGPEPCHLADFIRRERIGWCVPQGDVDATVATIRDLVQAGRPGLEELGRRARRLARTRLNKKVLCGRLCDVLERGLGRPLHGLEENPLPRPRLGSG